MVSTDRCAAIREEVEPAGGGGAGGVGGADLRPLPGAPAMYGQWYSDVLGNAGGGVLVARSRARTIEVSHGGYAWAPVTSGR